MLAGSTIGLLTVLATEKRGSYGLAIVLPGMALFMWRQQTANQATSLQIQKHWKVYVACALLGIVGLWSIKNTPLIERPVNAINLAIKEFKSSQTSLADNYNSNVGARLYLWAQAVKVIPESPWLGYGHDQRKQLLKQWATDTQLPDAPVFGHVHSDYLHTLLDHGLWGLASFLSYALGLMVLTLKLMRHKAKAHAIGLTGILLMHLTTALSNVNLAHNYYPTILSLVICITLWSAKGSSKTTTAP
jgi:O-antigen ligase